MSWRIPEKAPWETKEGQEGDPPAVEGDHPAQESPQETPEGDHP